MPATAPTAYGAGSGSALARSSSSPSHLASPQHASGSLLIPADSAAAAAAADESDDAGGMSRFADLHASVSALQSFMTGVRSGGLVGHGGAPDAREVDVDRAPMRDGGELWVERSSRAFYKSAFKKRWVSFVDNFETLQVSDGRGGRVKASVPVVDISDVRG